MLEFINTTTKKNNEMKSRRVRIRANDITKLLEGWRRHGQILLAVDYDDTIKALRGDYYQELIDKAVDVVKRAQKIGAVTTIFTSSKMDRYPEIRNYCSELGIRVDSINENSIVLKYADKKSKLFYNILLDDKAGLPYTLELLELCCEIKEEENES